MTQTSEFDWEKDVCELNHWREQIDLDMFRCAECTQLPPDYYNHKIWCATFNRIYYSEKRTMEERALGIKGSIKVVRTSTNGDVSLRENHDRPETW